MFFGEKKILAGHNPPPLNHGFGVILACTSFLVPVDTIFVVLILRIHRGFGVSFSSPGLALNMTAICAAILPHNQIGCHVQLFRPAVVQMDHH